MNAPKMTDLDYIMFLVAAPHVVSCTEAARVQRDEPRRAAHDAVNRLLQRLEPALDAAARRWLPALRLCCLIRDAGAHQILQHIHHRRLMREPEPMEHA